MKFEQKLKKLVDNLKNIGITKNDVIKSDTLFENDFSTPNGDFVFELIEKVFNSLPIKDSDLLFPPQKHNISSGGVIKYGNNLMGCIYTVYVGGVHHVQIATLPKYRGLGLSKILWVRLLESLSKFPQKLSKDTPIRQMDIAWNVNEDNIKSRNLAKRLGF